MQIGNAQLTTEHVASSKGIPVLVYEGNAYGPEDMIDGFPAGGRIMTLINADTPRETIDAARAWLK